MKVPNDILQSWEVSGNLVGPITEYVKLSEDVANLIYEAVGISKEATAGDIAYISEAEWNDMVAALSFEGAPLPLLARSRVRQLYGACRAAALVQADATFAHGDEEGEETAPEEATTTAVAPPPALALANEPTGPGQATEADTTAAPPTPTVAGQPLVRPQTDGQRVEKDDGDGDSDSSEPPVVPLSTATKLKKTKKTGSLVVQEVAVVDSLGTVKLDQVALQGSEAKVKLVSLERMREGRRRYRKREGSYPTKVESPTREQVSAFLAILEETDSIYLDFAVFGPHGDRLIKQRRFDALIQAADGTFKKVELLGPATYREWLLIYRVFRTLCIMYDVIVPAFLDRYAAWIQQLNDENPECWGIIYQSDVRARLEHAPDVREQLEDAYAEAIVNNKRTDYNPEKPWNAVWNALVQEEDKYWFKHVEHPGLRISAGTAKPSDYIEDDAPVKRPGTDTATAHAQAGGQPKRGRYASGQTVPFVPAPPTPTVERPPKGGRKGGGEDLSVHDGTKYLNNRVGHILCRGVQA